jgi:predicted nucleotidyltransferase
VNGPLDVLKEIVKKLNDAGIEYFLVGSLASMYYGKPRFTNDIDLVVQINPIDV